MLLRLIELKYTLAWEINDFIDSLKRSEDAEELKRFSDKVIEIFRKLF